MEENNNFIPVPSVEALQKEHQGHLLLIQAEFTETVSKEKHDLDGVSVGSPEREVREGRLQSL